ncbi:MAG: hypothetical protein OEV74_17780 [Cyclobacteriaceae bacterium]|jgi:hypothetical protein|nr:hypothetical protein [Cyclobacteriaceae bacterium]MDH4298132.1 hypothetical protein [Cyclobacteriaceae bacterium]MDH5250181.1 hypothetical protein [Cyclobacteriaceae bacterium]
MIKEFVNLTDKEVELMFKAPVLVCILIAGADGNIDRKELKEAIAQSQKLHKSSLVSYLKEVSLDFEDKLKVLLQSYPYDATERNTMLIEELGQLNGIWGKIDMDFAAQFYHMLRELAERIAASSGGLWGMKTVTGEEAKLLQLSMISEPSKN